MPLTEDEKDETLLRFYTENQILWTTVLIAVIFGAFTLLESLHAETGVSRVVILAYYEVASFLAGIPVYKWLTNIKLADEKLKKLGIMEKLSQEVDKVDKMTVLRIPVTKKTWFPFLAWALASVIVGFLGIVVYLS